MMLLNSFSQFLLYGSFALLMGSFILKLVPTVYKPVLAIPEKWMRISVWLIPIATFVPMIQLIVLLLPQFGLIATLQKIGLSYKMGNAWLAVVVFVMILLLVVRQMGKSASALYPVISICLLMAIQASVAYASHASSMDATVGFLNDFIHLVAVSCWLGILLVVSCFTTSATNWEAFLKWFTPLALVSVTAIALSGVFLTETIVPAYVTGWSTYYGIGLFMKHVLLVPLAFIILGNGILIKLKLTKPHFNPLLWVRFEMGLLVAILAITAIFSEFAPPRSVVQLENVSPLFQLFYDGTVVDGMRASFQMTGIGLAFFLLTAVFIVLLIVNYVKEAPLVISALMAAAIALCFYFGFLSITFFA